MKAIWLAVAAVAGMAGMADAKPPLPIEGTYLVEGGCPNQAAPYHGTLAITRAGEIYTLRWEIGGEVSIGRGIEQDGRLAISYVLGGDTGVMIAGPTAAGWEGRWTLNRGDRVCFEHWRRR